MSQNNSITIGTITIHQSDNGLYLLTDLWKASGKIKHKRPQFWLDLKDTKAQLNFLKTDVKVASFESQLLIINTGDKSLHGTYACEDLVYAFAMWVSPKFYFLVIRTFRDFLNATTTEQVLDVKSTLDNATQNDFFSPFQQPRDKQTLQVIMECSPFQAEQFHNELICDGLLEKIGSKTITQRILGTTSVNRMVVGKKGDTLLWDAEALKQYFSDKQLDWIQ